jgi:hypothetical protein
MGAILPLLSRYFWLLALAVSAYNYFRARRLLLRSSKNEQAPAALSMFRLFAIAASLPWLVMGAGQVLGFTPSIWHYFRPQDGNPFVLAWLAVIFLLTALYAWWVLFAGGAQTVYDLNLLAVVGRRWQPQSIRAIKLSAALALLFIPVWVWLVVRMNVPIPTFSMQ